MGKQSTDFLTANSIVPLGMTKTSPNDKTNESNKDTFLMGDRDTAFIFKYFRSNTFGKDRRVINLACQHH